MPNRKKATDKSLLSAQYEAALSEYEKGIRLMQQKDYQKAIPRFESVIKEHASELSLGDRARAYLRICAGAGKEKAPLRTTRDPAQSFEVGAFLLNEGEHKEALRHLERAAEHEPKDAGVRVSLASARMGVGDVPGAKEALRKAVELNPSVKHLIRSLADFDDLDDDPEFNEIVE